MTATILAGALGLALGQVSWQAGLRGEVRALREASGDLLAIPSLGLEYIDRDVLVQGYYTPQLLFREPSERGTSNVLQSGGLVGTLRLGRDTRLGFNEQIASGATDLSWLATPPDAAPYLTTTSFNNPTVQTFTEATTVDLQQRVSRELVAGVSTSYSIVGGSDPITRLTLPQTKMLRIATAGTWVERRDAISLTVGGNRNWVSNGLVYNSGDLAMSWRHAFTEASQRALLREPQLPFGQQLGPRYETVLAAGIAAFSGDPAVQSSIVPTVSLTLLRTDPAVRPGAWGAHVTAQYVPVYDGYNGALVPRAELTGGYDVRVARQLVAIAGAGAGRTFQSRFDTETLAQGGLALRYEASPTLWITPGFRIARLPQTEWAGVVTVAWMGTGRM